MEVSRAEVDPGVDGGCRGGRRARGSVVVVAGAGGAEMRILVRISGVD